jgi:hypothetical protein
LDAVLAVMADSGKKTKRTARDARLAAALRENLKRRKAQARARERGGQVSPATGVGGIGRTKPGKK